MKVGSQTEINVSLEDDISGLNDVVVIGYGTAKKKDVTGSVSNISSKRLLEKQVISDNDYNLIQPIDVDCENIMKGYTELTQIYRKGKTYRVNDIFNNYWNISSLPIDVQVQLALCIISDINNEEYKQHSIYKIY